MDSRPVGSRLAVALYRALMAVLYPACRLAGWGLRSADFSERLGVYSAAARQRLAVGYNVWLHAASAGEVNAIDPFCRAFRAARPGVRIVLTTSSRTGKKIAKEKGLADEVFLAPLDMGGPLRRAFGAFRPLMVLVAETEFWPNWLFRAGRNGVPILLVNGRVSDRSFPSYRRLKSLFSPALNCFTACLVQTPGDREKLAVLGVSEKRIQVAGQMKYDLVRPAPERVESFRRVLGLGGEDVLFTLGSLREGEDDLLLPSVPGLLGLSPKVKVLVAPRHPRNAGIFREKLLKNGVPSVLRTSLEKDGGAERVVVLDTVGELSLAYALSRGAFVGGTLAPVGGHNVMEPALSRVPVCFGPHTSNVAEAAEVLGQSGGGFPVRDAAGVAAAFGRLLEPGFAAETGQKAFEAVSSMRGATERTVRSVLDHWPEAG